MKSSRDGLNRWSLGCVYAFWRNCFDLFFRIVDKIFCFKNQFSLLFTLILFWKYSHFGGTWHRFYQAGELNYLVKLFLEEYALAWKDIHILLQGMDEMENRFAGTYLYQTTLCEGLPVCKILQTRVINVSCCQWKSQALGVPPPVPFGNHYWPQGIDT